VPPALPTRQPSFRVVTEKEIEQRKRQVPPRVLQYTPVLITDFTAPMDGNTTFKIRGFQATHIRMGLNAGSCAAYVKEPSPTRALSIARCHHLFGPATRRAGQLRHKQPRLLMPVQAQGFVATAL